MSNRSLKRCKPHGLAYDPKVQDGCTLCRNSMQPKGAPLNFGGKTGAIGLMVFGIVGLLLGAYYLDRRFPEALKQVKSLVVKAPMPPPPKKSATPPALPSGAVPAEPPMLNRPGVDRNGYPRDTVDRVTLLAVLHAGQYASLTKYVEQLQSDFEADFHKEDWITNAIEAFGTADPRIGDRIEEWLKAHPASFAPLVARAQHRLANAWYYRGGDYSRKTASDRLDKFQELLSSAEPDATSALKIRPKLVVARGLLIQIANGLGRDRDERPFLDAAIAACPECFRVRSRYMIAVTPRWGGSYAKMDQFAAEAQAQAGKNSRLKALLGYADWDRCDRERADGKLPAALAACDRALAVADFHMFLEDRAAVLQALGRREEALDAIDRAVDQVPHAEEYLRNRAELRLELGRLEDGVADLRLASTLDPSSAATQWSIDHGVKTLVQVGYRRSEAGDQPGAIAAYDLALALSPNHEDALRRKGRAQTRLVSAGAVEQLEARSRTDPSDYDAFMKLDEELVKTREFSRIVEHWTRYLAAKPEDGRGYLERGGALLHAGDPTRSIADLRRACSLGIERGCQGARRVAERTGQKF